MLFFSLLFLPAITIPSYSGTRTTSLVERSSEDHVIILGGFHG